MIIRNNMYRCATTGIAALCLAACLQTPDASDIPLSVDFSTKILADDTKLFAYAQRFIRGDKAVSEGAEYATIDNRQAMRERDSMRVAMAKTSRKGLEAMLSQNNYCREDYMVLEQYEQHGSYIIRGECRDSATPADREKFLQ